MTTLSKLGVSSTNLITPQILVATKSLPSALSLGTVVQIISLAFMILYVRMDKKNEDEIKKRSVSAFFEEDVTLCSVIW